LFYLVAFIVFAHFCANFYGQMPSATDAAIYGTHFNYAQWRDCWIGVAGTGVGAFAMIVCLVHDFFQDRRPRYI